MKLTKAEFIILLTIILLGVALNILSFSLIERKLSAYHNQIQRLEIQVEYQHNKLEKLENNIKWQHDRTTKLVHDLGLESLD